jgi:hypothetical protein
MSRSNGQPGLRVNTTPDLRGIARPYHSMNGARARLRSAGRTVITLAVDDWLLERLLTFDAGAEDHEDNGDDEPEDDAEVGGPPSGYRPAEEKPQALRCSFQSSGPFPSISACLSPLGCRPSRIASAKSGAKQVSGRSRQT